MRSRPVTPEELTRCDSEPIHVPGSIQPHGVLLVLREPELEIVQVSASVETILGPHPHEVLGRSLQKVLGKPAAERLASSLDGPLTTPHRDCVEIAGQSFDSAIHRHAGATIVELELAGDSSTPDVELGQAITSFEASRSLEELLEIVVDRIQALTGFDRVLVYRFDEDDHGRVVAERRTSALDSYMGLHFPATDIPQPARRLYRLNPSRFIADAALEPVPIVPAVHPDTGLPLDLSLVSLRSVSPIHVEYLHNMHVRTSLSLSVTCDGRLWGLLSCASRTPRPISRGTRNVCETLAKFVALQIGVYEETERCRGVEALSDKATLLVEAMRRADGGVLCGLLEHPRELLEVANATGAAVLEAGRCHTVGEVPDRERIEALGGWLDRVQSEAIAATRELSQLHASGVGVEDRASGVLTFSLPDARRARVLWFRPEVGQTVRWGGDPRKPVEVASDERLRPRTSFEAWTQRVRGQASAWRPTELEIAERLRRAAIEIDLHRSVELARRAVRARDDLISVVSHDLRGPMNVVQLQAELMKAAVGDGGAAQTRVLRRGIRRVKRPSSGCKA